jgi:Mn-containing catalase
MILRVDRLQVELPAPSDPDPAAAAHVQELLGGRFGEMSTLMNYTYQSFNFRGRQKAKPFYDLIANIATEEYGHIELVSAVINGLLTGASEGDDVTDSPLKANKDQSGIRHHWINSGFGALPVNSLGQGWNGEYVFNSGDLVLDLLHNFFLENGARMAKIRVYETTDHPIARRMLGYLFVRGGVHALAYAKALEELTGVDVKKMLPIPNIPDADFKEAREFIDKGMHGKLYRFSETDFEGIRQVWTGTHPLDGTPLQVIDGLPETAAPAPSDLPEEPAVSSPGLHPGEIAEVVQKLMSRM